MAPQKIRGAPEDSRFETSSTKEKQQLAVSLLSTTTKARRTVSAAVAAGSNLKDVTAAAPTASEGLNGQQGSPELIGGVCHNHHASPLRSEVLRLTTRGDTDQLVES